jgi:thiamine pyrophosphokinase
MASSEPKAVRSGLVEMGLESRLDFLMGLKKGDFAIVDCDGRRIRARIDDGPFYYSREYKEALAITCALPGMVEDFGTVYFGFRSRELGSSDSLWSFVSNISADKVFEEKAASLVLNGELDPCWLEKHAKPPVYCADGAYNRAGNLKVEAVIGDFDSINDKSGARLIHMPDQNYTDFEKALMLLNGKYDTINIYGASGKDMDHFMGNLSAAKKYKDKIFLRFIDPKQEYFFINCIAPLYNVQGKTISIIPFPKAESIVSQGLEHELRNLTLELGGQISVRNRAVNQHVLIEYEKGCAVVFVKTENK